MSVSNYERLQARLNKTAKVEEQVTTKDGKKVNTMYAHAVKGVSHWWESAVQNVRSTGELFAAGREEVRDEIAGALLDVMDGKQ